MRSENVVPVMLEHREVVALFQFLARHEKNLSPELLQINGRLEKAVFSAATIEEMEILRNDNPREARTRELI